MAFVELLSVPKDASSILNFLQQNFRRIADTLSRVPTYTDKQDITITTSSKGIVLTAPNGNTYRIIVSNTGVLSTVLV
jgi:hypothetical protein